MRRKKNPIKQIMSDVHKDARAGRIDLSGHGGFISEVKRRARAAGLAEDEVHELVSRRGHDPSEQDGQPDRGPGSTRGPAAP